MNPLAAVLPNSQENPIAFYQQLKQQQEQQRRYEQQLQMQKDRSFADLIDKLDLKNDLTGTEYDGYLNHNLQLLLGNVANAYKNKGYVDATLEASRGANELKAYADKIKAVRANIFSQAEDYKNTPGLDYKRAAAMALTRAFHNYDDQNHQLSLRDPAEIDEQRDYLSDVLNNNHGEVWNGNGPLGQAVIDRQKHLQDYDKKLPRNIGGMIRDVTSKGKFDPLVHLPVDAKGNPVDLSNNASLASGVRIKGEPVLNATGQPVLINNQPLVGVPDDVVNTFAATKGTDNYLTYAAKHLYPGLPPEQGRKVVLYDYLKSNPYGYIRPVEDKVSDAQIEREKAAAERQQRGFDHTETMAAIRAGNSGKPLENFNDLYGRIESLTKQREAEGDPYTQANALDQDGQNFVSDFVNKNVNAYNDKGQRVRLDNSSYYLKPGDKKVGIFLTPQTAKALGRDAYVGSISAISTNAKINTGKAKQLAVHEANTSQGTTQTDWRSRAKKVK